MDLYCKRCGEPWELDYVQFDMTPKERNDFKHAVGCPACKGKEIKKRPFRAILAAELSGVLGDDLDGLAAEMEDAEQMIPGEFWSGEEKDDGEVLDQPAN